jgi:hypothetical protein
MTKRVVPYLFLALLCGILLFIVGVRYGQRVEQVNKTVKYLVSIPPTPTTAPTTSPLSYSDYTHPGCKVSFLIPSSLEKTSESSSSAVFSTNKGVLAIAVSCEKKPYVKTNSERQVTINKTIKGYETGTKDTTSYRFYHVNTTSVVTLTAEKSILPLVQKSLTIGQ